MSTTGPRVSGSDGLYAREIALQDRQRAAGYRLLAVLGAPLGLRSHFQRRATALAGSIGQAQVGAESEQTVIAALRKNSDVAAVVSGLHLSPTSREDIDQTVLLTGGAVAVVEVKTRRGFVRVVDGVLVSGKDRRPFSGDPLAQVTRGAGHVQRALEDLAVGPVHRIICVAPAPNDRVGEHRDGQGPAIRICTATTLDQALTGLSPTVDPGQVRAAERTLKAASRRNRR